MGLRQTERQLIVVAQIHAGMGLSSNTLEAQSFKVEVLDDALHEAGRLVDDRPALDRVLLQAVVRVIGEVEDECDVGKAVLFLA